MSKIESFEYQDFSSLPGHIGDEISKSAEFETFRVENPTFETDGQWQEVYIPNGKSLRVLISEDIFEVAVPLGYVLKGQPKVNPNKKTSELLLQLGKSIEVVTYIGGVPRITQVQIGQNIDVNRKLTKSPVICAKNDSSSTVLLYVPDGYEINFLNYVDTVITNGMSVERRIGLTQEFMDTQLLTAYAHILKPDHDNKLIFWHGQYSHLRRSNQGMSVASGMLPFEAFYRDGMPGFTQIYKFVTDRVLADLAFSMADGVMYVMPKNVVIERYGIAGLRRRHITEYGGNRFSSADKDAGYIVVMAGRLGAQSDKVDAYLGKKYPDIVYLELKESQLALANLNAFMVNNPEGNGITLDTIMSRSDNTFFKPDVNLKVVTLQGEA